MIEISTVNEPASFYFVCIFLTYFSGPPQQSQSTQKEALSLGIAEIIWKCGSRTSCTLCLPDKKGGHVKESGYFNIDGVTENVTYNETPEFNQNYLHIFSFFSLFFFNYWFSASTD